MQKIQMKTIGSSDVDKTQINARLSTLTHGSDKLVRLLAVIPCDIRGRNDNCNFS